MDEWVYHSTTSFKFHFWTLNPTIFIGHKIDSCSFGNIFNISFDRVTLLSMATTYKPFSLKECYKHTFDDVSFHQATNQASKIIMLHAPKIIGMKHQWLKNHKRHHHSSYGNFFDFLTFLTSGFCHEQLQAKQLKIPLKRKHEFHLHFSWNCYGTHGEGIILNIMLPHFIMKRTWIRFFFKRNGYPCIIC